MNKLEQEYWKVINNGLLPNIKNWEYSIFDVLTEDRNKEMNIGQNALGYIKSCIKTDILTKIDLSILKGKILKNWKYYNDFCICCMETELWTFEMDFNKLEKSYNLIKKIDSNFSQKFSRNNKIEGLLVPLSNDKYVILMNENVNKNELSILYEFIHYVQYVTHKLLANSESIPLKILSFFNLTDPLIDCI